MLIQVIKPMKENYRQNEIFNEVYPVLTMLYVYKPINEIYWKVTAGRFGITITEDEQACFKVFNEDINSNSN